MRAAGAAALAVLAAAILVGALCPRAARAEEPLDTLTFKSLPEASRLQPETSWLRLHRTPLLLVGTAVTVMSLVASQLLLRAADRRYDLYRGTVDPSELEAHYLDAQRFDRWSNALVVLGEVSAAATLYLAWRGPDEGPALSAGPAPLRDGYGLRIQWGGR